MWLCTHEACKVARSVYVNSDLASQYECDHVKLAKNTDITGSLATYSPSFLSYPCSDSVRANLNEVVSLLPHATPAVIQVSDQVFAVFGLHTASNPLGFCHVKREGRNKSGYSCTAKDCRSFSSKAKGSTAKAFCLHLHLLSASLEQFSPAEQAGPSSSSSSSSASQSEPVVSFDSEDVEDSLQRKSTIILAYKTRSLPYQFPRQLLHSIMARDSCTLLGVEGSWPSLFQPSVDNCGLCESPLGHLINHPGQQTNSAYLVTELNPFKKVDVKVRVCQSKLCMAIDQPFPADIGKVIELFSRIIYL